MKVLLISWIVAVAAYILFAGQFSGDELAAAPVCGLAAGLWFALLRRAATQRFRFERGDWAAAMRAVAGVPAAAAKVSLKLLDATVFGATGELTQQAFVYGKSGDRADAGRRAIAVLARSLAPDSFVVRTPQGEDAMLIHALFSTDDGDAGWVT